MKAFSKNGKSCLCQVPRRERKFILPETGCNYCGCHGCNPIDMKYNKRLQQKNVLFSDNTITHKNQRILDSEDEDLKVNDDLVDYYNKDKKDIQENLSNMLKINSIFYGFGVPLRIPSYILGYNPAGINYIVGAEDNYPKSVHHISAFGVYDSSDKNEKPEFNVYTLYGVLAGRPGPSDDYVIDRANYQMNEVALDYNAGFQLCLAALIDFGYGEKDEGKILDFDKA
jgi:hypothetical protein